MTNSPKLIRYEEDLRQIEYQAEAYLYNIPYNFISL